MKVSFIVPVYKVEKYLRQCVESITSQNYKNIEILLVDDGSPDNSPVLCEKLASEDSRIVVIHKENGGLSDARNVGLKKATGDYVVFVDGDDFWVDKDALLKLVGIAQKQSGLDFIGFNCSYYYPSSNKFVPWVPYDISIQRAIDKNAATTMLVKSGTFPMSACLKIMKREFLVDNNLFFKKGQLAEDIPWFINVLEATNKCCFVNEYAYAYRQNVVGSITNVSGKKSFDSLFDIFKTELQAIEKRSFNSEAKEAIKSFLAYEYCILLTYKDIDKETKEELLKYQSVLSYNMNPKVRRVSKWYKVFGIRVTIAILSLYRMLRRN